VLGTVRKVVRERLFADEDSAIATKIFWLFRGGGVAGEQGGERQNKMARSHGKAPGWCLVAGVCLG